MLTSLGQVWRRVLKAPIFSATVVASIGLGIAANVLLFGIANSLFFRPLTPHEPEKLVFVYTSYKDDLKWGSTSYPDFRELRDGSDAFEGLSAERIVALSLGVDASNQRITGSMVSPVYFQIFGIPAFRGRTFGGEPGDDAVIVLSHALWARAFGADPGCVGRSILVNGVPFTAIGVMPRGFRGAIVGYDPQFWIPFSAETIIAPASTFLENRDSRNLFVLGRMKDGATIASAAPQLNRIASGLAEYHPKTNANISFTVIPAAEGAVHPLYRPTVKAILGILFVVVGIVLLTVCANVATMLLARAQSRYQEFGIRLALGSSRMALVRQLLAESLLLSFLGAGVALLIVAVVSRLMESLSSIAGLPLGLALAIDVRMFGFTCLMALLAGLLFGLAPAFQSTRANAAEVIKEGSQASGYRRSRLRTFFIFGQAAFAVALVVAAMLLIEGLQRARGLDLGFASGRVATAAVDLGGRNDSAQQGTRLYRDLTERLARLPQVESITLASSMPLDFFVPQRDVASADAAPDGMDKKRLISVNAVYPGYFGTLGIPVLQGRDFGLEEDRGHRPVTIVNQKLAQLYWPQDDPIGKSIRVEGTLHEVVGVVADTRTGGLSEPARPFLYFSLLQEYWSGVNVLARTRGNPAAVFPGFRQALREVDPSLALYKVQSLDQHLETLLVIPRIGARILGSFGLFAVALSCLGLYGSLAYAVSRRSREIGIRIALGSTRAGILRMVMGEGMRVTLAAVAGGLLLAAGVTRFLTEFLFGVNPLDPAAFGRATLVFLAVAGMACYFSARKALSIDPVHALKESP